MDAREQRGLAIAALTKLKNNGGVWQVPSQTGQGSYFVGSNLEQPSCTCPDFELRGKKCKHIFAVEYTIKRETHQDGSETITQTMTVTEKISYKQNWPAYNLAQAQEKNRLQVLLADLCKNLPEENRDHHRGPKPHLVKDSVFAMAFKVYCGLSSRRFSSDLLEAHEKGFTSKKIPGAKVTSFFEDEKFTPILTDLVVKSAAPLASVETNFAVDSTGFSSTRFERWFDQKYGVTRKKCVWIKAHVACGVKTNIITAVRILEKDTADSPQFTPLVKTTSQSFTIKEVSADKAYSGNENFEMVDSLGGKAYIAFKANATGGVGGLFAKMLGYFQFQRDEYLAHYHKRSNIESTFSAVKRKFGDSVMSKTETAMKNEVLCKLLCHNLTCLIHEQENLGITPLFLQ